MVTAGGSHRRDRKADVGAGTRTGISRGTRHTAAPATQARKCLTSARQDSGGWEKRNIGAIKCGIPTRQPEK